MTLPAETDLPPLPDPAEGRSFLMGALRFGGFVLVALTTATLILLAKALRIKGAVPVLSSIEYKLVCACVGIRLRIFGQKSTAHPTIFVANHSSYLDVPALGAAINATFVAKADVAQWPVFGFLTSLHNTVFVERRRIRAKEQTDVLRDHLASGKSLIFFPEGTSTDGLSVLPFKSSLFSPAEAPLKDGRAITVQAVSVTCTAINELPVTRTGRLNYAWVGDVTLVPHLWNAFCLGDFTVDVVFHEPTSIQNFADRKQLADHCQKQVAAGVERSLTGRYAPILPPHLVKK